MLRKIKRERKLLLLGLKLLGLGCLAVFSFLVVLVWSYAKDLPRPEDFNEKVVTQSTKIFDRRGQVLLYEVFGEEKRTVVPLDQISPWLQKAVIATEDADFYQHHGVNFKSIVRAALTDLKFLKPTQGASTISQQLIRSSYLGQEKTTQRKTKEIILTLELERRYSKDQILGFYLNQIPFGQNAYGAEAASQVYFGQKSSDLSLEQAALLAALIQAPGRLSPWGSHKDELLLRKDYVLARMRQLNFITPAQEQTAEQKEIVFIKNTQSLKAPHFTLWIRDLLENKYGEDFLREKGLRVYTSLDWDLQQKVEKIVEKRDKTNRALGAFNAAVVVIDPQSGDILSLVGSKDFWGDPYPAHCQAGKNCLFDPQFDAALAERQPGSSFKPFVYVTAFEKGFDDKTRVVDEPTNFGVWGGKEYVPQNYDGRFRGLVTLRQALAQSLNIPSIKVLLQMAGLENSVQTARNLGLTTLQPPFGPSIVLGGYEVKLLEMTGAYAAFANHGLWFKPQSIRRIEDADGNILEENPSQAQRVLDSRATDLLSNILADNAERAPIFGENSALFFPEAPGEVSVKTGTTQDYRDGWTIGYNSRVAVGVWAGNNNNTPILKEPGVSSAGPIFHQVMQLFLAPSVSSPKEIFLSNP